MVAGILIAAILRRNHCRRYNCSGPNQPGNGANLLQEATMHDAHRFLETLAMVLCAAAVTTVLFQRLKQPVVLGYLLAGMLVGPHVSVIPFVADADVLQTLAELGVILLMFSLGIEFSLSKLLRVGPTAAFVAILQCSLMFWLGFVAGEALGWPRLASFYAGAAIAISSSTIIIKVFDEQNIKGQFTQLVFGILIVQDLIAVLLITVLTTLSRGTELSTLELAQMVGRLVAFIVALIVVGLLTVPRLMRAIVRLDRNETTVVASVGLAFGFALLAAQFRYSVALGAFLAGSLVAESGVEKTVERLVLPVRDLFAAIFFVSVGTIINPAQIAAHWPLVLLFLVLVVLGMVGSIALGAFLAGESVHNSVKTGMTLAQIGEFSFIIASVGTMTGAADRLLYPIVVAVSAMTTLLTPWLIRVAGPTAAWVDRKLPRSLQTFAALYGSWLDQLTTNQSDGRVARIRGLLRWVALDAISLVAIIIGASVELEAVADWARSALQLPERWTKLAVVIGAAVLAAPFAVGLVRVAGYLGFELACRVFPSVDREKTDLAAAPRRLLVVTLQLAIVLVVGVPLVAITQPFLPPYVGAFALFLVFVLLAVAFWRGAANFQGHTRAAAQALAESLSRQTRKGRAIGQTQQAIQHGEGIDQMFLGLGSPVPVELPPGAAAVGKTLAQIKLRGLTGATVLAIQRGDEAILVPSGHESLNAGDVLALAGTREAVAAARELLAAHD
jgi:CPA2 family monovalent cation:H+ antiporter-2